MSLIEGTASTPPTTIGAGQIPALSWAYSQGRSGRGHWNLIVELPCRNRPRVCLPPFNTHPYIGAGHLSRRQPGPTPFPSLNLPGAPRPIRLRSSARTGEGSSSGSLTGMGWCWPSPELTPTFQPQSKVSRLCGKALRRPTSRTRRPSLRCRPDPGGCRVCERSPSPGCSPNAYRQDPSDGLSPPAIQTCGTHARAPWVRHGTAPGPTARGPSRLRTTRSSACLRHQTLGLNTSKPT